MSDYIINILCVFLLALVLLQFTVAYIHKIKHFSAKKAYLKMEIDRAHSGELKFWKKKLLKEYLLLVPILSFFIKKYMK